jgi:hypothetical protein
MPLSHIREMLPDLHTVLSALEAGLSSRLLKGFQVVWSL